MEQHGHRGDSIRIVIGDDHALFRTSLKLLLDRRHFDVVGLAASGAETIDQAVFGAADVVVMDVRMPGMDGIEATRRLLALRPETKVIAVSAADDNGEAAAALAAGAAAFLRKDTIHDSIVDLIQRVCATGGELH